MVTNTLIEGQPGVGKTTLIRAVAARCTGKRIGGFFTAEIREQGHRAGFRFETFDGRSGILSHVQFSTGPQVGKYRVDLGAFEQVVVAALEEAVREADVIFIDEIGKMELFSGAFREAVVRCLDSEKPVVATVMLRSHPFVDPLKARPDVRLVRVTLENRNSLTGTLVEELS